MNKLTEKTLKNALIAENLLKLTKEERRKIILRLLSTRTERQLSTEINIPRSTLHDWKTLRQDNTGEGIHVSLSLILRKLEHLKPENIEDWGRLEQIKEVIENLLRKK